jgi:parvulin-like peptidyl-prolyl isomerase
MMLVPNLRAVLLAILLSGTVAGSSALGQTQGPSDSAALARHAVATVNGEKIGRAEVLDVLAKGKGGEVLDRLVELKLIDQEMNRRHVVVPEDAVDARIKLMNQTRLAAGRESFEDALRKESQPVGPFRRGIRMKIAMEMMAKADFRIPQELGITNLKLEKWYKALKDRAQIVGRREELPAGVFATVNGDPIPMEEFNELLWINSSRDERAAALDFLIKQRLVKQALDKKGLVVAESDLDAELARLQRAYARSAEFKGLDLDTVLQQQGMAKSELRADPSFAAAVGLRKLIRADLAEDQARGFFKEHEFEYSGGLIRVSQIFISTVDTRTGAPKNPQQLEEASKKIADLKRQLDGGADFAVLAKRFSEDNASAPEGGDLGFIPRFGKLVEPLCAAVFALKKGEVSQVIATPIGFYLLKATDTRPGPKTDFETVKADVYEDLINTDSEAWFAKLQKAAHIEKGDL